MSEAIKTNEHGVTIIDTQQLLAERRASGWLPALAIGQATGLTEAQVVESLSIYGNPMEKDDGHFYRWNWVYEWAQTQFKPEGHEDFIRETAEGILPRADGDWDRAVTAAIQHTAQLWAAEVVEAVLDING